MYPIPKRERRFLTGMLFPVFVYVSVALALLTLARLLGYL